jgi:hypothetical protein
VVVSALLVCLVSACTRATDRAGESPLMVVSPEAVDEYHLVVVPTMLGGGTRVLPSNVCIGLDLLDERRFANGMVYLRYQAQA